LRIRRFEIRLCCVNRSSAARADAKSCLPKCARASPNNKRRIVFEMPSTALIDVDGGLVLLALEQLFGEPAARIHVAGNLHLGTGARNARRDRSCAAHPIWRGAVLPP